MATNHPERELAFPPEEYGSRLERLRSRMRDGGIDVLFLSAPESLCYLSGFAAEWYRAQSSIDWPPTSGIAVHVDADDFIHFDEADEELLIAITSVSRDVRIRRPSDPTMKDFIVAELGAAGWLGGTVGLEMWSHRPHRGYSEVFQARLEQAGCRVVDGTRLVRDVRRIKSPLEIERVREAQRIADVGLGAAQQALKPGVSELEVYGEMAYAMACAGGELPAAPLPVASGSKNASVHALPSRRTIAAGDIVNIGCLGVRDRYHASIARCFSVGAPSPAVVRYAERAAGVTELVADTIRPGLPAAELLSAVETYCRAEGIWEDRWWVGGYEIGIAFPPDPVGEFHYGAGEDSEELFAPGTTCIFEANFYLPESAGLQVQISTMVFTQDEAAFVSEIPPGLIVVG